MFFITKYRHNKIVDQYQGVIEDLRQALYRKEKLEEICDKLTEKVKDISEIKFVKDHFGTEVKITKGNPFTITDTKGKKHNIFENT